MPGKLFETFLTLVLMLSKKYIFDFSGNPDLDCMMMRDGLDDRSDRSVYPSDHQPIGREDIVIFCIYSVYTLYIHCISPSPGRSGKLPGKYRNGKWQMGFSYASSASIHA